MEGQPLITVITASYNSKYLYEAIDSVLSQTYPKIEYIVTDDGTRGFEKEAVEQYIEQNQKNNIVSFQVIYHPKNLGTVRNLNNAMKVCTGEYIFHLAADDIYTDNTVLERWLQDMQEKQSMLSTSCFRKCNEDFSESYFEFPFEYQKRLLLSGNRRKIFNELSIENFVYGCSTARSRDCLEQFGLYDEAYRLVEDYPYVLRYARQGGKIDLFDHVCINYRQGGTSSSGRFNPIYEKDSDLIFQRDILPYVKWKLGYKLVYFQWKRNQITGFWQQTRISNKLEKICLYLANPIQLAISLQRYLQKQCWKFTRR